MLLQAAWAAQVPHAGAMALIDAVVEWNATSIHAVGERHALSEHPLRGPAGLHAVHLAEYGAQASAVHAALLGETAGREGRLVSLREVLLAVEYVDLAGGRLDIHAHRLAADGLGAQYRYEVLQGGRWLASGRLTVMYASGV